MSEHLTPLYDKQVKCPVCATSYSTKKVRSRFIRVEKTDTDFFTYYKDQELNPIFYEVNVCPKCGYAFVDTFSNSFSQNALEKIKKQITENWKKREFSNERTVEHAAETYKLALLSGVLKQEKSIVIAGVCLRLSWIYRMLEDFEQEQRFMKLSLEKYIVSYMETDYLGTQMTEMRLLYLIGELHRRTGDRDGAVTYFSKVINHKNRSIETKLIEMAREQWYLTRDIKTEK